MNIDINDINTSVIVVVDPEYLYEMGNPAFITIYDEYGYGYLMKSEEYLRENNSIRIAVPERFDNNDIKYNFRKYVNDFDVSKCLISYKNPTELKNTTITTRINKFCLHYK